MGIVERIRNWFKRPPARVEAGKVRRTCYACRGPLDGFFEVQQDDRLYCSPECVPAFLRPPNLRRKPVEFPAKGEHHMAELNEDTIAAPEWPKVYTVRLACDNCGNTSEQEIPQGVTVRKFLDGKKCSRCGCGTR